MTRVFPALLIVLFTCFGFSYPKYFEGPNPDELSFQQTLDVGFKAIYDYDFPKVLATAQALKTKHKDNPRTYLLEANYYWWKIISGEKTEDNYKKMEACLETALNKTPKTKSKNLSNEELYNIIHVYAYRSRVKIYQEKYIPAAKNLNTCIEYVEASFGKENEYELFKLTSGLYYYFVDYGYENYVLARAYLMFLPDGDANKGLDLLLKAFQSKDLLVKTEAAYFLMKIYCELENKQVDALKYVTVLTDLHPNNLLYRYYHCKVLLKQGQKEKAMEHLTMLQSAKQKNMPHAEHFVSLAQEDLKAYYANKE